eukprot:TRINITY_DN71112_c0_g1_i1.p2 TRINITY_DN71112_c0_g1~~TRINITY_DN71112_c0_g1_i1.p2  ORF type:complete len:146 (-),score=28.89 TRINITY_DN71112_c0_g1_i1:308-745(-)
MKPCSVLFVLLACVLALCGAQTLVELSPSCSPAKINADIRCACKLAEELSGAPSGCSPGSCGASANARTAIVDLTVIVRSCLVLKPGQLGAVEDPVLGDLAQARSVAANTAKVLGQALVAPSVAPTYRRYVGDVRKARLARFNKL